MKGETVADPPRKPDQPTDIDSLVIAAVLEFTGNERYNAGTSEEPRWVGMDAGRAIATALELLSERDAAAQLLVDLDEKFGGELDYHSAGGSSLVEFVKALVTWNSEPIRTMVQERIANYDDLVERRRDRYGES